LHQKRDSLFEEVATLTVVSKSIEDDVSAIMKAIAK